VIPRDTDPESQIAAGTADVIVDVVAGPDMARLLGLLKRGGRYAIAGAIAGPVVELDLRTVYLRDLSLVGCTFQEDVVFENLIGYIVRGEIRPVVAKTYPLKEIVAAQRDFLAKRFVGKLVLIPPQG
jgi:NADPH:quinone reductase-like Zn-dependent oxidoreductase